MPRNKDRTDKRRRNPRKNKPPLEGPTPTAIDDTVVPPVSNPSTQAPDSRELATLTHPPPPPGETRLRRLLLRRTTAEQLLGTGSPSPVQDNVQRRSPSMAGTKRRPSSDAANGSLKQRMTSPPLVRRQGNGAVDTQSHGEHAASHYTQRTDGTSEDAPRELQNTGLDELTGLLPGDVNAITMIVNAAEKRIASHVSRLCNKLALDMKACETVMSDVTKTVRTLDTNVSNLKVLALQNSAAIARSSGSGRGGSKKKSHKGLKSDFQIEIEVRHPNIVVELPAVFHSEIFSRALGHSLCSYMDEFHRKQDDYRMTARTLSVVLYGKPRDLHLAEFKQGGGKQHANFRFKIALSATREALLLSDNDFMEEEKAIMADLVREGKIKPGEIEPSLRKPAWLSPRMLTKPLMIHARKYHECLKAEHDPLPKGQDERLALQVCRYTFKGVMDMLRLGREKSKVQLLMSGLFLLLDWTRRDMFKPGHTLPIIRFTNATAASVQPQTVQDCSTVDVENYAHINYGILRDLMSSRDEMVIDVTYMVTVVVQKASRASDDVDVTELRQMRRQFKIVNMALMFLRGYTQSTEEVLLSSHRSMLRTIYRIAVVLREIFIDMLEEDCQPIRASLQTSGEGGDVMGSPTTASSRHTGGRRNDTQSGSQSRQNSDTIPSVRWKDLIAADYDVDYTMARVLKISLELYDKLMKINRNTSDERDSIDGDGDGVQNDGDQSDPNGLDSDDDDYDGMVDI